MCTTTWIVFMCVHPDASGPTVDKQTAQCEAWEPGPSQHCGSHRKMKRMVRGKCAKCVAERDQEVLAVYAQIQRKGGAAKTGEKKGGQGKDRAGS
jgi:hypothetical protein